MIIEFLKSASVIIRKNNKSVLVDPWLTDGEYYGSWYHYPQFDLERIKNTNIDYIYISHVHPDHMSKQTLSLLNKDTPVLIHKYDKPFLKYNLMNLGYKNVIELEHGKEFKLDDDFYIKIFAADGCDPVLCQKFFKCYFNIENLGSQQIDTLSLIFDSKNKILNVNDCPLELAKNTVSKIGKVDLLLTGYSGAGPFPQCFPEYSSEKKIALADKKKNQFIDQAFDYIKMVKPKYYMPFAGTYYLGSNFYDLNKYRGVPTRFEAASILKKKIGNKIQSQPLLLKTFGTFDLEKKIGKNIQKEEDVFFDDKMKNYLKGKKINYYDKQKPSIHTVLGLLEKSSENFFSKSEEKKLFSEKHVGIKLEEDKYFNLNLNDKKFKIVNKKFYMNKKFLILDLDMRLLQEILKGPKFAHWDNADIGSHIKYYRNPDNYDRALNHALNFLHS